MNYYNEFDPKAAAWLQQLIDDQQIPYGYVDSRSILEVHPSDLSGFTQCHFFAGIGGWSLALSLAGFPESEPVWTASLPCQPFSTAGKQLGTDDERHLAPVFLELVRACKPPVIIGEQVASKGGREWFGGAPDVPKLRTNEALLRVLCELQGIGQEHMQRMLQEGRREIETADRIDEAIRELLSLSEVESGEGSGEHGKTSRQTEGDGLQSGCTRREGDRRTDQEGLLSDVASTFQPGRWEDMGLTIAGPNRQHQGIRERECSCDSFLFECDGKRVGDGESDAGNETHGCGPDEPFSKPPSETECDTEEEHTSSFFAGIRYELEGMGYETGCSDLCAPCAGEIGEGRIVRGDQESWERVIIGHPHIRQRLYWVADSDSERRSRIDPLLRTQEGGTGRAGHLLEVTGSCKDGGLADASGSGCERGKWRRETREEREPGRYTDECGSAHRLPDTGSRRHQVDVQSVSHSREAQGIWEADVSGSDAAFQLLPCRDGKTRRTQSGIFPLVDGIPRGVVPSGDPGSPEYANATAEARAMRLKGYGNAIVPPLAALFIKSYMEATQP